MKKWNYFLLLLGIGCFLSCSKDENTTSLPPDLGGTSDLTVNVGRDTADSYKITVPVIAKEGLVKITLQNSTDSKLIDEKTVFTDPYACLYEYVMDLSMCKKDTTISLLLKVEDQAAQVVSKKIIIHVKEPAQMSVGFAYSGEVVTYFADCALKLNVKREGILPDKVKVYLGEQLATTYDLKVDEEVFDYVFYVNVPGLKLGENKVKAVLVDKNNQEFSATATINREAPAKVWSDVNGIFYNTNFHVNKSIGNFPSIGNDKFYRLSLQEMMGGQYMIELKYDEAERVRSMAVGLSNSNGVAGSVITYAYTYNSKSELIKVTIQNQSETPTDYITNVVYECGTIKSYDLNDKQTIKTIKPKYIEKDGEMIKADYLDKALSGYVYGLNNKTWANPMYIAALPPVVPGDLQGLFFNILYNRYIFDTLNDGGTVKFTYTIGDIIPKDPNNQWAPPYDAQTISWIDGMQKELRYSYYAAQ